jgi:hypothetical protein
MAMERKMAHPKKSRSKTREKKLRGERHLVPVTAEEIHFAAVAANAAASGRTPRQSFASLHEDAFDSGKLDPTKRYLMLTDAPENHKAFAIMDAFPEKTPEGDARRMSLLWRVMFALPTTLRDPRAATYLKTENGQSFIGRPLLQALGTTPMKVGKEVPVDAIFVNAERIAQCK